MTHLRKFATTLIVIVNQGMHLLGHLRHPRAVALRLLRVPCGACGGTRVMPARDIYIERWCWKPFGHCDSHYYEDDRPQPLTRDRRRSQGWKA